MRPAHVHPREPERLAALHRLGLLDTPAEERFDRLARLASILLGAPIALVSLVDRDRQWFKARVGVDVTELPRDLAICSHAIVGDGELFEVPDARGDDRFREHPLVTGDPAIRFYAGRVLRDRGGLPLGTLCVVDHRPRSLTEEERTALHDLASLVEEAIAQEDRDALLVRLDESERVKASVLQALAEGIVLVGPDGSVLECNPAAEHLLGHRAEDLAHAWREDGWDIRDEDDRPLPRDRRPLVRALSGETVRDEVVSWLRPDGQLVLLRSSCVPDADGRGAILVTLADVTEERRMLDDLARFSHLFEHANDIITVIDADGQIRFTSPSSERVLGYPRGWQHDHGILGLVHPDDLEGAWRELALLMADERGPEPFTVRVRAHSGEWRHVECVGVNLLHEPSVQGIVLTSRDATDRVRLTDELAHLATHDPLTGLLNRSTLEDRLQGALARAERLGGRVAACFVDLDHFKSINDLHGHDAGDEVIVEVAERLRAVVRTGDAAMRLGGDEFVVILDGVGGDASVATAAHRIHDAILHPPIARGELVVGASMGVAVSTPGERAERLLQRADRALYRAKAAGRGTVAWSHEPGRAPIRS